MGFGGLSISEMHMFDVRSHYSAFISFWFTDFSRSITDEGLFYVPPNKTALTPYLLMFDCLMEMFQVQHGLKSIFDF